MEVRDVEALRFLDRLVQDTRTLHEAKYSVENERMFVYVDLSKELLSSNKLESADFGISDDSTAGEYFTLVSKEMQDMRPIIMSIVDTRRVKKKGVHLSNAALAE